MKIEFLSAKGFFSPFFEKNMWMQTFLVESHISHNSRPLVNSPNSQNEIVVVHSRVVRLFPVWTPSQSPTCAINRCGVNGLVSVHRPNLRKTKVKVQHDTHARSNDQRQFTAIHPSDEQAANNFVLSSQAICLMQPLME
jgi:hypothetical protein